MDNKVEIENYRGWTIYFDTDQEKFYSVSQQDDVDKTNRTYSAAKKAIDDYLKDNQNFKPLKVQKYDKWSYKPGIVGSVIGRRKDGRLIIQIDGKADPEQISNYDLEDWIFPNTSNDQVFNDILKLYQQEQSIKTGITLLKNKLVLKTLKDWNKENGESTKV